MLRYRFDIADYLAWPPDAQALVEAWLDQTMPRHRDRVIAVEEWGRTGTRVVVLDRAHGGGMARIFTADGATYASHVFEVDYTFPWADLGAILAVDEAWA